MLLSRDADLSAESKGGDDDYGYMPGRPSSSDASGGPLSSSANRQRTLDEQKQRLLKKQQIRRGATNTVQANRAFTGASRKISGTAGASFRNFSAPKAIDPLEGDDDLDSAPRKAGYADNFRGTSRAGLGSYGGVYEAMQQRPESRETASVGAYPGYVDPRVANVHAAPPARSNQDAVPLHPNLVESKEDHGEAFASGRQHSARAEEESKVERDLKSRGIAASFDPTAEEEEEEEALASSRGKSAASKARSTKKKSSRSSSKQRASRKDAAQPTAASDSEEDKPVVAAKARAGREAAGSGERRAGRKRDEERAAAADAAPLSHRSSEGESHSEDEREAAEVIAPRPSAKKAPSGRGVARDEESKVAEPRGFGVAEQKAEESVPRGLTGQLAQLNFVKPDLTDMRSFLMNPVPKEYGTVQCYIERNKSGAHKLYPEYQVFLKEGDRFLMTSKKRAKNRTTNYVVSMDPKDYNRESPNCLGKLRSNFIGTEFQIFDRGMNPKNADPDSLHVGTVPVREELGAIQYASNVLGSRGPRKMKVGVPAVSDDCKRVLSRPMRKSEELLTRFKERDMTNIVELINKPPRWNDHVGAYVLNFSGRVTMASVKNFQLITTENEDDIVLTFGRCGANLFSMDVAFPLSPFQAFCIAMSSASSKLACE